MRQLLINSNNALIARMPRPAVSPGEILVKVHYSMVSVGTELATLRVKNEQKAEPTLQKAKNYTNLAKTYLGKAIRNPQKAIQKARFITRTIINQKFSTPKPAQIVPTEDISWQKANAHKLVANGQLLIIETDDSAGGYQAISNSLDVPEGYAPRIELRGKLSSGTINLGVLDETQKQWLGSKLFTAGDIDDRLVIEPSGSKKVTIVISNTETNNSTLSLDDIQVAMVPPEANGLPHNEMADQGWNVGYSAAGEVIAIGSDIKDIKIGDYVACAGAGKANHADYIAVPRNLVCRVPKDCSLKSAASTTIGTIALQGIRRAKPTLGETFVVLGLGLLGQLTVQMLKANGCKVIGLDLDPARVERALELGMDLGDSGPKQLQQLIHELTQGQGADCTIITAATKSDVVINQAMQLTRRKGRVVIVGDVGLNIERPQFYKKEIDLLMSTSYGPGRYDSNYEEDGHDYPYAYIRWTSNRNMQAYMDLIAEQRIDVEALIDKVIPITEAPEVYQELASNTPNLLGVLIEYDTETSDNTVIQLQGHRKPQADKINYVLVGAGAFGTSMLVPQLDKLRDTFFLKGVVSRDAVRGGNFARTYQLETFASELEPILQDDDCHLLVIATRHSEHAAQVIKGLKAGKHVFVEKPLALTWEELEEINETYLALENPPILMVGFNRRFSPAMQQLKQELTQRRSPLIINYRLNSGYINPEHWIQGKAGGGRNLGEACHMYDCFRFLAGAPITDITATAIEPENLPYLKNDNFSATLGYADGSIANLIYTALGPKKGLPKERIEVFCDGEAYLIDDFKSLTRCSDNTVLWNGNTDKGHHNELQDLANSFTNNSAPIPFIELMETSAAALQIEDLLYGKAWEPGNE